MGQIQENSTMDFSEIQGNVIRNYRSNYAAYCFFNILTADGGRAWLQSMLFGVTYSKWPKKNGAFQRPPATLNIALSSSGLSALGVSKEDLESFPKEFREGMLARAVEILGDEPDPKSIKPQNGDKSKKLYKPKNWLPGFKSENPEEKIHALVIITAKQKKEFDEKLGRVQSDTAKYKGVVELKDIGVLGEALTGKREGDEHFGYKDGISQPFIEGTEEIFQDLPKKKRPPFPGQGTPVDVETWKAGDKKNPNKGELNNTDEFYKGDKTYWKHIKPGEIILGYQDEIGQTAQSPSNPALRNNGTYLVFRKLYQDVPAFRSFLQEKAYDIWKSKVKKYQRLLAAKLMGRWESGCPLILSPEKDNKNFNFEVPEKNNDFLYSQDKNGEVCPLGSHIRRTNPRDFLKDVPENWIKAKENRLHLNRHRIIRRGMPYGEPLPEGKTEEENENIPQSMRDTRGLVFVAFNANIGRQFEFIQQNWVNKGEFLGVDKNNRDPFIGMKHDGKATFSVQGEKVKFPFATNLQSFVIEKGGEYFFYPSRTALHGLADGKFSKNNNFPITT